MSKKIIKGLKSSKCMNCSRQFYSVGPIEFSFCTKVCESNYIPPAPIERKTVTNIQTNSSRRYPFDCVKCGKQVTGYGGSTKAHKKQLCTRKCPGLVADKYKTASLKKQKEYGKSFYTKPEWLQIRYQAISKYGRKCRLCNASDIKLHVDHIKPRSKYPELALSIDNLQVLCEPCNLGKGNWDETDWR